MSDTKTPAPDVARKLLDIVTGIPIIERGGPQDYQRGFLDGQRFTRDVCADRMRAALSPGGEREGDGQKYVIWSNEHGAWWRPKSAGYTRVLSAAGLYSHEEAQNICNPPRYRANSTVPKGEPAEVMVLAPGAMLSASPAPPVGAEQWRPTPRGGAETDWWQEWVIVVRRLRTLEACVKLALERMDANLDRGEIPHKYLPPFAELAALRAMLSQPYEPPTNAPAPPLAPQEAGR